MKEYCIISDDSGHDYICPADKEQEASAILEAIEQFWSFDNVISDEADEPSLPDYLVEIGCAISRVKFTNYRID